MKLVNSTFVRRAALRLCLAWAIFSALGLLLGGAVLRASTPLLSTAVAALAPDLMAHVECVASSGPVPDLLLDARTTRPLPVAGTRMIPAGQPLPSRATGIHALVPLVILLTALSAVPAYDWRERALLAVLALPLGLVVLLSTAPFHLVGLIELALQDYAAGAGLVRPEPWSYRWMLFLEGGGRWVLPIGLALGGYALVRRWTRTQRSARSATTQTRQP